MKVQSTNDSAGYMMNYKQWKHCIEAVSVLLYYYETACTLMFINVHYPLYIDKSSSYRQQTSQVLRAEESNHVYQIVKNLK